MKTASTSAYTAAATTTTSRQRLGGKLGHCVLLVVPHLVVQEGKAEVVNSKIWIEIVKK